MQLLKNMKNPDNCNHTRIAIETIETYSIPIGYDKLMEQENIDMEDYKEDDTIINVTRCLDCGEELDRSPAY